MQYQEWQREGSGELWCNQYNWRYCTDRQKQSEEALQSTDRDGITPRTGCYGDGVEGDTGIMEVLMHWDTSAALGQGILSNCRGSLLRSLQNLAVQSYGWSALLLVVDHVSSGSAGDSQRPLPTEASSVALLFCNSNYISRNRGVVGIPKTLRLLKVFRIMFLIY